MRLFLAAVALVMAATPAGAQWLDRKTPGIPRTPDGKPNLTAPAPRGPDGKPDFTGAWRDARGVGRRTPAAPCRFAAVGSRSRFQVSGGVLQDASLLRLPAQRSRGGEIWRDLETH